MRALMIVPSRDRPNSISEIWSQWNTSNVDLMVGLDDDNAELYPILDGLNYEVNPRLGMGGTLNMLALKHCDAYDYIGFMGDDHRPRTPEWGNILMSEIGPLGIGYGDDGHQGHLLPTAVMMSANIVQTLGYMAPPKLHHLYLDNSWKSWGEALGALVFCPHVLIEHMHPAAGKGDWDSGYEEVNSATMYSHDLAEYEAYMRHQFALDMEKLRGIQVL